MQYKENIMRSQYFQQKTFNPLAGPVHEIIELNVRTIQQLSYIDPTEVLNVNKPEAILEKQVDVMIKNSHAALDYVHNMFNIMEKHMLSFSDNVVRHTKETIDESEKVVRNRISEVVKGSQSAAKKVVSGAKKIASSAAKKAPVAAKSVKSAGASKPIAKTAQAGKTVAKKTGSSVKAIASTLAKKAKPIARKSVKPVAKTVSKTAPKTVHAKAVAKPASPVVSSQNKEIKHPSQAISANQVISRSDAEKKSI